MNDFYTFRMFVVFQEKFNGQERECQGEEINRVKKDRLETRGKCQQRHQGGVQPFTFTHHCGLGRMPPFFPSQVIIGHQSSIGPPSHTGYLLCPGPGRIQAAPLGKCPGLGTLTPKECIASCPWRLESPCLSPHLPTRTGHWLGGSGGGGGYRDGS